MSDEFRFSPRPNRASEIPWRAWGPEAFTEAKLAQRPILLAISAVWCHWCHVMDETTYSDPAVIRAINERYVAIRVDNDKRPDVNRRYNMGGWPTTAFLTPDGEVVSGGTYLPPEVMGQYLEQVAELYRDRRAEIEQRVAEIRLQEAQRRHASAGPLQWSIVEDVIGQIRGLYDAAYGGFGREPKFPQPHLLRLLLDEYRRHRGDDVATMLHRTLAAMASGGMHDAVEGGFFRYATTRQWESPHYEKMLEDNSDLLAVFAEAHRTFPDSGYDRVARDVMEWMRRVLWQPETHLFGGSQDADEEYYRLDADGRKSRRSPFVDPVRYTSWNALAASAFTSASSSLGADDALGVAGAVLGAIRGRLWDDADGTYHFDAGAGAQLPMLLTDLASLLAAQVDLYEAGAGTGALDFAKQVAEKLLALEDAPNGGFFDALERQAPGRVSRPDRPIEDNAMAADALLRLATLTGEERWRETAIRALRAFAGQYHEWGQFAAPYARAVARALAEPLRIVVTGEATDARANALWRQALACDDAARVLERLDPTRDRGRMEALGYVATGVAAYVCVGTLCSAPIADANELRRELDRARERFGRLVR